MEHWKTLGLKLSGIGGGGGIIIHWKALGLELSGIGVRSGEGEEGGQRGGPRGGRRK